MTAVAHTAVGGAIGAFGMNAPVSFILGALSHYPLDIIPHWDLEKIWIDTVLTIGSLVTLLIIFGNGPIFWGALGGALPDLEHLLHLGKKIYPSHGVRHGRPLSRPYASIQIVMILASSGIMIARGIS